MTRIKEPDLNSDNIEVPDYKSPAARVIRSLRLGYDNLRKKGSEKSKTIQKLREQLRDTQESRDSWKERTKAAEAKVEELLEKSEEFQKDIKKKPGNHR